MRYGLLTCLALLAAVLVMNFADFGRERREAAQYCQMVYLFNQTGGDLGWPDYNRQYTKQCTPGGKLRKEGE